MSKQYQIPPQEIVPKEGVKTSSFKVFISTLIVGAVFSYLIRRGVSQEFLDAHKGEAITLLAEALPYAYFGLVGYLGKVFIRYRQSVSQAKAEALKEAVRGLPTLSYRELLADIKDADIILPLIERIQTPPEIDPNHLTALTRLAQEIGRNRKDLAVILLALSKAGLLDITPEEIDRKE